jgi:hypothetical protein
VRRFTRAPLVWVVAAVATAAGVLAISSETDDGGGQPATTTPPARTAPSATTARHPNPRHRGSSNAKQTRKEVHHAVAESPAPRLDPEQRQVVRAVRAYVGALNASDGKRVCALFVPGALDAVDFPRDRGGCAPSLSASVGYRDPRGFPVYARSRIARIPKVAIQGSAARVTATIVTRFAEGREPSIEDDLVYLAKRGGRWLIVKPSATLYRAIGVGDIPPQVLAPP